MDDGASASADVGASVPSPRPAPLKGSVIVPIMASVLPRETKTPSAVAPGAPGVSVMLSATTADGSSVRVCDGPRYMRDGVDCEGGSPDAAAGLRVSVSVQTMNCELPRDT